MANHKSAEKRLRANDRKRLENRYYAKTMRNALKDFRLTTDKTVAEGKVSQVTSLIDKLAKKGIIHANKAANLKSGMMKKVNAM
jgi:small subunit ribosomal protein S20